MLHALGRLSPSYFYAITCWEWAGVAATNREPKRLQPKSFLIWMNDRSHHRSRYYNQSMVMGSHNRSDQRRQINYRFWNKGSALSRWSFYNNIYKVVSTSRTSLTSGNPLKKLTLIHLLWQRGPSCASVHAIYRMYGITFRFRKLYFLAE